MPDEVSARVTDAQREEIAKRLRQACAARRLTVEELAERIDRAYAARLEHELAALVGDLPGSGVPMRSARRLPVLGSRRERTDRFVVEGSRAQVAARALAQIAPLLVSRGYTLASHDETELVFTRAERPGWTIAVAILLFPLGLLALLHRRTANAIVAFVDGAHGTEVTVHGMAPLGLRRAFAQLRH
jgi:transcriptional regulator with XRE-family HTH domain